MNNHAESIVMCRMVLVGSGEDTTASLLSISSNTVWCVWIDLALSVHALLRLICTEYMNLTRKL